MKGVFSVVAFINSTISSSLVTKLLNMLRGRFRRINFIKFANDKEV